MISSEADDFSEFFSCIWMLSIWNREKKLLVELYVYYILKVLWIESLNLITTTKKEQPKAFY